MNERLPKNLQKPGLERLVSEVVASRLAKAPVPAAAPQSSPVTKSEGVCFISSDRLLNRGGELLPVAEKALVADAMDCGDGSKLAGGFMEWEKASFRRTVEQAEMAIVLRGELHLTVGAETLKAKSGDMLYLPKGAELIYSAPGKVRIACVNCIQ